jgi:hypothetical protein
MRKIVILGGGNGGVIGTEARMTSLSLLSSQMCPMQRRRFQKIGKHARGIAIEHRESYSKRRKAAEKPGKIPPPFALHETKQSTHIRVGEDCPVWKI